MGLPEFIINFKKRAETAAARAERGIVAIILADNTKTTPVTYSYTFESDVDKSHWTSENFDYIQQIFKRNPLRVIVQRVIPATLGEDQDYKSALEILKNKTWNYLVIPGIDIEAEDSSSGISSVQDVCDWIKEMRDGKKRFKAVLPCSSAGVTADNEGIIDFATDDIVVGVKTYTAAQYCPRIAGILATVPLSESGTYELLPEVESITESNTPDDDIDGGKLILINDGENIKIARAVNSLTTIDGTEKTNDWKKIKIIDAMDFICDDIRAVFESSYIGIANSYDNKQLFIATVNDYLADLARQSVLDANGVNEAEVDLDSQTKWLQSQGIDVSSMTEDEIKKAKTGSYMFVSGTLTFLDAIEDLMFTMYM